MEMMTSGVRMEMLCMIRRAPWILLVLISSNSVHKVSMRTSRGFTLNQ